LNSFLQPAEIIGIYKELSMAKRPPKQTLKDKLGKGKQDRNSNFVAGVHGDYFIGTDPENLHHFSIETAKIPGGKSREPYTLEKIVGDVSAFDGGQPVGIPFSWLFKEASTCKFAPGNAGIIQSDMLTFLKDSLKEELAAAKEACLENQATKPPQINPDMTEEEQDMDAQIKANALMKQIATRPHDLIFTIATVDGKAVKPRHPDEAPVQARPRENLLPLSALEPGKFGRYDFGADGLHCVVDYFEINNRPSTFYIAFMHPEHPLAQAGVEEKTSVYGKYISKDSHVPFPKNFEGKDRKLYESRVLMRDFFLRKLEEVGKVSKAEEQPDNEQAAA
jgi:hypothetical protein